MGRVREITGAKVYFHHGMYILMHMDSGYHLLECKGYIGNHGTEQERLDDAVKKINELKDVEEIKDRIAEYNKRIEHRNREIKKLQDMIQYEERVLREELSKEEQA